VPTGSHRHVMVSRTPTSAIHTHLSRGACVHKAAEPGSVGVVSRLRIPLLKQRDRPWPKPACCVCRAGGRPGGPTRSGL
jgi:hypothetical protein